MEHLNYAERVAIPVRKQLEAFYERYQREGVPNDLSMQAFCSMHNVPYNCFERHHTLVTVTMTATPPATSPTR